MAYHIPLTQVKADFAQMDVRWLCLALLVQLGSHLCAGLRWWLLMRQNHYHLPLVRTMQYFFAANLLNQGLPSTMGGDGYRVWQLYKNQATASKTKAFMVVVTDRLVGVSSLVLVGALSLLFIPFLSLLSHLLLAAWAGGALLAVALLGLAQRPTQSFARYLTLHWARIGAALQTLYAGFGLPYLLPYQLLGMLIHIFSFAAFACCCLAFHLHYPIATLVVAIAGATLLSMLPISISGWGVRESALLSIFTYFGLSSQSSLSASLMYGVVMLVSTLPGAYILFFEKSKK